jgi:Ca2+-binding RTX toxin-like protein
MAGAGHDEIWGGFGNDELWGGAGDDFIYGGKGDDKIEGQAGFDVFYIGQAEGEDAIQDHLAEVNAYNGDLVEITFVERGGSVTFDRAFNSGTGLWESSIDVLNLWDYGDGDAGNSSTVPPQFERDLWSATFDATTDEFTAFTLAVDG